jgi:hypothetical protein
MIMGTRYHIYGVCLFRLTCVMFSFIISICFSVLMSGWHKNKHDRLSRQDCLLYESTGGLIMSIDKTFCIFLT